MCSGDAKQLEGPVASCVQTLCEQCANIVGGVLGMYSDVLVNRPVVVCHIVLYGLLAIVGLP